MLKYILFFAGILTMSMPDDVSLTHMAIQGLIGLLMMCAGVFMMLEEQETR